MSTQNELQPLLTESEAAAFLNFTPRAMQAWRTRGGGPAYIRVSARAIRYRQEDIDRWLDERRRTSTSDESARTTGDLRKAV